MSTSCPLKRSNRLLVEMMSTKVPLYHTSSPFLAYSFIPSARSLHNHQWMNQLQITQSVSKLITGSIDSSIKTLVQCLKSWVDKKQLHLLHITNNSSQFMSELLQVVSFSKVNLWNCWSRPDSPPVTNQPTVLEHRMNYWQLITHQTESTVRLCKDCKTISEHRKKNVITVDYSLQ